MTIHEKLAEIDPEIIILSGLDEAIIGVAERINLGPILAYSVKKIIEIFVNQGMTEEEAYEYYNFNVVGAYLGEYTPIFINTI